MDNTDISTSGRTANVLIKTYRNTKTGETRVITKPLTPVKSKKVVIAKGKGKKTVGAILIARLRPFRFAMVELLKRRGINAYHLPFKTLIPIYFNNFCLTDFSVKPLDISEFSNHVAFKLAVTDETNGDIEEARNMRSFMDIAEVLDHIIAVFKGAKESYRVTKLQGLKPSKYLTDEQLIQAKACMIVERKLAEQSKYDNYVKTSDILGFVKIILWVALLYYIAKSL
jgi:hypothetical protein